MQVDPFRLLVSSLRVVLCIDVSQAMLNRWMDDGRDSAVVVAPYGILMEAREERVVCHQYHFAGV